MKTTSRKINQIASELAMTPRQLTRMAGYCERHAGKMLGRVKQAFDDAQAARELAKDISNEK